MNLFFNRCFLSIIALSTLVGVFTSTSPATALSPKASEVSSNMNVSTTISLGYSDETLSESQMVQALSFFMEGRTFVAPNGSSLLYRSFQRHQNGYSIDKVTSKPNGDSTIERYKIYPKDGHWYFVRDGKMIRKLSLGKDWLKLESIDESLKEDEYAIFTIEELPRGGLLWTSEKSLGGKYSIFFGRAE